MAVDSGLKGLRFKTPAKARISEKYFLSFSVCWLDYHLNFDEVVQIHVAMINYVSVVLVCIGHCPMMLKEPVTGRSQDPTPFTTYICGEGPSEEITIKLHKSSIVNPIVIV